MDKDLSQSNLSVFSPISITVIPLRFSIHQEKKLHYKNYLIKSREPTSDNICAIKHSNLSLNFSCLDIPLVNTGKIIRIPDPSVR
jgi:hypothetical protein